MGFSVNGMFDTLLAILSDDDLMEDEKFAALEQYIHESHQYAIDCGVIQK